MEWTALLVVLLLALAVAWLFAAPYSTRDIRWSGGLPVFVTFFVVILLAAWAAALWFAPVGPVYWGVAWVPVLFVAILVALLLAAIAPNRPSEPAAGAPSRAEERAAIGVGLFFWVAVMLLFLAIVAGYLVV